MPKDKLAKNKISIYIPKDLIDELKSEARRLDRNNSWIVQKALRLSLGQIKALVSNTEGDP